MQLDSEGQKTLLLNLVSATPLNGTLDQMTAATAQLNSLKAAIVNAKVPDKGHLKEVK
jgi:hypothetical protein